MIHLNQVNNNNVQIKLRRNENQETNKIPENQNQIPDIIGFGIISKISVKLRDNDFTITNSTADISLEISEILRGYF